MSMRKTVDDRRANAAGCRFTGDLYDVRIIGAGVAAQAIARHVLPFGYEVLLSNSRGPDTLADVVGNLGRGAPPAPDNRLPIRTLSF